MYRKKVILANALAAYISYVSMRYWFVVLKTHKIPRYQTQTELMPIEVTRWNYRGVHSNPFRKKLSGTVPTRWSTSQWITSLRLCYSYATYLTESK